MSRAEAKRNRERQYRAANPGTMYQIRERHRQKHIKAGKCAACIQPAILGKTLCNIHLSNLVEKNRQRLEKSKELKRCTTCHQRPMLSPLMHCAECRETKKKKYLHAQCKKFGITVEQYEEMNLKQDGKCAICLGPPTEQFDRLHIDHNHKTGLVRGLLCNTCNTAIGHLKDDPQVIIRAAEYVRRG